MKNIFLFQVLFLVCLFGFFSGVLYADIAQKDLPGVLDVTEAQGVEFQTKALGASAVEKYTNDHIAVDAWADVPKKGAIKPVVGKTFVQMTGTGTAVVGDRAKRVKASFSFRVGGAGELSFNYRAATWGWDDDVLIFYENDINNELRSLSGECWATVETWDGEKWYDMDEESFWNADTLSFGTTQYFHTINVALLAPEKYEGYEKPDTAGYVVPNLAWLDNFVWEADEAVSLCDFVPASGTQFGGVGGTVFLESDYSVLEGEELVPILDFYYTTDGKTPTRTSSKYDGNEGISITKDTVLRVAVYEKGKLITDSLSAEYTLRPAPGATVCAIEDQDPFDVSATVNFGVPGATVPMNFVYTLDGTMPTLESSSGKSCQVDGPCVLKVCANDEGCLGPVSTFDFKYTEPPTISCTADGVDTKNPIFDGIIFVKFVPSVSGADVFCQEGAGLIQKYTSPLEFTDTTQLMAVQLGQRGVRIENGGTGWLNSDIAIFRIQQTEAGNADWITSQLVSEGWNVVAIPRDIAPVTGRALAEWLKPYGYSVERKAYELATTMEPGHAYMVYNNVGEAPEVVRSLLRTEESTPAKAWDLLDGKALFRLVDGQYQPVDPAENYPGWSRATE